MRQEPLARRLSWLAPQRPPAPVAETESRDSRGDPTLCARLERILASYIKIWLESYAEAVVSFRDQGLATTEVCASPSNEHIDYRP